MRQLHREVRGCRRPHPRKETARTKEPTVRIARKRTAGKSNTLIDGSKKDKGAVVVRDGGVRLEKEMLMLLSGEQLR